MVRKLVLVATLGALMTASLPAAAHHPQLGGGDSVAFDHVGGNEWWVEVRLVGSEDHKDVKSVSARDDNQATWVPLELKDWDVWAGSFHIEDDNRLRFRAVFDTGTKLFSCQFTHPDGLEECNEAADYEHVGGGHTDPWRGTYREYLLFDHLGGDATNVKVKILGGHPDAYDGPSPTGIYAQAANHNEPTELERTGWRTWEGTFDTPMAGDIQFHGVQGSSGPPLFAYSCAFTHPQGLERCDAGEEPYVEAEFTGVSGNEWWVQVDVDASKPLRGVDARVDDDGAWMPLERKDWGAWAASFHVPDGANVEFRAQSTDWFWDMSEAAWAWPDQVQIPAEGEPAVLFHNVRGDENWFGVNIHSNEHIAFVWLEERDPESSPAPYENYLRIKYWGDWAGDVDIEPGQDVRIHADEHTSEWYAWPCWKPVDEGGCS